MSQKLKKNIFILTSGLGYGGSETFVIELYNYLILDNYFVKIICLSNKLDRRDSIQNNDLICLADFSNVLKFYKLFKILNNKNNVLFSVGIDVTLKLLFLIFFKNCILFERTDPRYYPYSPFKRFSRNIIYKLKQKKLVLQSFSSKRHLNLKDSFIIHKNIYLEDFKFCNKKKYLNIICISRFSEEKNHISFINSLFNIKSIKLNIIFIGDGPLLNYIKTICFNLPNNINLTFLKNVNNVNKYIRKADLYIHPSKYEGVSNSILEALSLKIPVLFNSDLIGMEDYVISDNLKYKHENEIDIYINKFYFGDTYSFEFKNYNYNEEINTLLNMVNLLN